MAGTLQAVLTHRSGASAEQVYDGWLSAEQVRVWMPLALKKMGLAGELGTIEIEPRVGGLFKFTDHREMGESCNRGEYLELERPGKIRYTWIYEMGDEFDASEVEVVIEPNPGGAGCVITLTHELDEKWADYVDQCTGSWRCMFEAIEETLQ
jgi:uncharacterized protein YndB with AHSA1/START domain